MNLLQTKDLHSQQISNKWRILGVQLVNIQQPSDTII